MAPKETSATADETVLVDAHVHIYECFDLASQLRCAYKNFSRNALRLEESGAWSGCLLLTESHGFNWFDSLYPAESGSDRHPAAPGWTFRRTREAESVLAEGPNDERLYIVAGRQIVVRENLELLALCTQATVPDGLPMAEVVSRVLSSDGIPAIPWGAGKWWFSRGRFLDNFVRETADVCLGDNSNRPYFLSSKKQFSLAEELGMPVLPGTDPLPIGGEEERTGRFGFALRNLRVNDQPAAIIREAVLKSAVRPVAFGELESTARFFRNQLVINFRKRLPRRLRSD